MSKSRQIIEPKTKFEIPSWAGRAPPGTHLNVMKGDKLVEKLLIDEKSCYYFGRNSESCDFMIEHASCSRVHAVIMFHRHLKRMFICDLGSMHGSFIRNLRLDPNKPTPVPFDTLFHFGASTRSYVLKDRPQVVESKKEDDQNLELPLAEDDLDNLTEFNTAHNKRVTALPVDEPNIKFIRRKRKSVVFAEDEEIINLEDVDSSVGRFRNMISVQVIPSKRQRGDSSGLISPTSGQKKHVQEFYNQRLYDDLDEKKTNLDSSLSRLGGFVPNLAPEVETNQSDVPIQTSLERPQVETESKPRKKYTKEAWPGKRPAPSLLV